MPRANLPGGWAGDLAWHEGAAWVAWTTCVDPEPPLLAPVNWQFPLRREAPLAPGATPDDWRRLAGQVGFRLSLGRLGGDGVSAQVEIGSPQHAIEGPCLAALPGSAAPAVVWSERREGGHILYAAIGTSGATAGPTTTGERRESDGIAVTIEVVARSTGAMLNPRAAADVHGQLWVTWQQWPDGVAPGNRPDQASGERSDPNGGATPDALAERLPQVLIASRQTMVTSQAGQANNQAGQGQGASQTGPEQTSVWSAPVAVSPAGQSAWAPALATGRDGSLWCVWDAWCGTGYQIFARRGSVPEGRAAAEMVWSEPVQVSQANNAPYGGYFHVSPDVATRNDQAWVVWSRTPTWGRADHRFNHTRSLHAAVLSVVDQQLHAAPPPGAPVLGEVGRLPVISTPFMHTTDVEFINPQAPRIRAGADGQVVVFFRQFRSAEFKDFGWTVGAIQHTGQDWSVPEQAGSATGFPDTAYGAIATPSGPDRSGGQAAAATTATAAGAAAAAGPEDSAGPAGLVGPTGNQQSQEHGRTWLLAYHAGDYPLVAGQQPSKPVANHRLVVETARLTPRSGDGNASIHYPLPFPRTTSVPRQHIERPTESAQVRVGGETLQALYGDLHRHSLYSKCMSANDGDPLDHWRWVRDVAGLDFYAITEHLEYMSFVEWQRVDDLAQSLAASGDLLALCGFELAIPPGHTNFFYADQSIGYDLRVACLTSADLSAVWPKLDDWLPPEKIVAIRHHQGHRGNDMARTYAPQYEPVVEIIQSRGEFPRWVQSLWRQGFRVGVVGATDHARSAPFAQGVTGVWVAPECRTRAGVLAGLRARRSFATNGPHMSVFLSAGPNTQSSNTQSSNTQSPNTRSPNLRSVGATPAPLIPMGDCGTVDGPPRLTIQATGTRPVLEVAIYRGERLLHVVEPGVNDVTLTYVDEVAPPGEHPYWLRVTQERETGRIVQGTAYSSPVWVTVRP